MAEINIEKMVKNVAEKALDEYVYQGKTLREWIQIILESQDKDGIKCEFQEIVAEYGDPDLCTYPEEKQRDCKTCKHSNNGKIAGTETCHECMYNSQYEEKNCDNCQYKDKLDAKCLFCDKEQTAWESRDIRDIAIQGYIGTMMCNGFSIAEIEKVLKMMKENINDNT